MAQFDSDNDDDDGTIVARGWVMRRGHCKRLQAPTRGRTAIWAEIQGQGKEVMRGRAVFKRSVGGNRYRHGSPQYWGESIQQRRNELRKAAQADAEEMLGFDLHTSHPADLEVFSDDTFQDGSDEIDVGVYTPCVHLDGVAIKSWSVPSDDDVPSTASDLSSDTASSLSEVSWEALGTQDRKPTPWQLAVARANLTAELYAASRGLVFESAGRTNKSRGAWRQKKGSRKESELQRILRVKFKTCLTEPAGQPRGDRFEHFRQCFLAQNVMTIGTALNSLCLPGQIEMRPTPLSSEVKERFLSACGGEVQGKTCPVWHGTDASSLDSIYQRGLLIPGQDNELKVKNGSVHGLGIYAATVDNPHLSVGYCRGGSRKLLVCGMLDADEPESITHDPRFVVIFKSSLVAPLYEATLPDGSCSFVVPRQTLQPLLQRAQEPVQRVLKNRTAKQKKITIAAMPAGAVAAFLSRRAAGKRR